MKHNSQNNVPQIPLTYREWLIGCALTGLSGNSYITNAISSIGESDKLISSFAKRSIDLADEIIRQLNETE